MTRKKIFVLENVGKFFFYVLYLYIYIKKKQILNLKSKILIYELYLVKQRKIYLCRTLVINRVNWNLKFTKFIFGTNIYIWTNTVELMSVFSYSYYHFMMFKRNNTQKYSNSSKKTTVTVCKFAGVKVLRKISFKMCILLGHYLIYYCYHHRLHNFELFKVDEKYLVQNIHNINIRSCFQRYSVFLTVEFIIDSYTFQSVYRFVCRIFKCLS